MRREFFGCDQAEAMEKARTALKVADEAMRVQLLPGSFGKLFKPQQVCILVDVDEARVGEKQARPQEREDLLRTKTDLVERAIYFLEEILNRMGIAAEAQASPQGEHIVLTVKVPEDQLDMRRGDSRELRGALQFLVNRVASSGASDELKFIVDVGGNLEERAARMGELAAELAAKAETSGLELNLKLMDSQDRRLVHQALAERSGIESNSQGEGRFRILTIRSKKGG